MLERIRQETSEDIIRWNYYGRLGEVTTFDETLSVKENTEENVEEEFRKDSVFIKVNLKDIFKSSFLKIPRCVPIKDGPIITFKFYLSCNLIVSLINLIAL